MKLYTRTGDAGETSLYGGKRRSKADLRVESYGEVDELQAVLGLVLSGLTEQSELSDVGEGLQTVQYALYVAASQLARPTTPTESEPHIKKEDITWLERQIDRYDKESPPLRAFIMQGGSTLGAHLHLARTVCRRAERALVRLQQEQEVDPIVLTYFNRLSDLLFAVARAVNHRLHQPETEWHWPAK